MNAGTYRAGLYSLTKGTVADPELLPYLFKGYIHQIIDGVQLRYSSVYNNLTIRVHGAFAAHRVATGLIDFTYNSTAGPLVCM